jgi:hypothetical protein
MKERHLVGFIRQTSQSDHQRKLSEMKGWKGKWLVSRKEEEDIFPRQE